MIWDCDLTDAAKVDLRNLPLAMKRRIARVLDQMTQAPFAGDVKALHGDEWHGVFRRRIGSYRILFVPDQKNRTLTVVRILARSKGTYR